MLDDDEEEDKDKDKAEGFAAWFGIFCPALGVLAPIWAIILEYKYWFEFVDICMASTSFAAGEETPTGSVWRFPAARTHASPCKVRSVATADRVRCRAGSGRGRGMGKNATS
jgi:hypothetical protein